jgi:hypothetical protein
MVLKATVPVEIYVIIGATVLKATVPVEIYIIIEATVLSATVLAGASCPRSSLSSKLPLDLLYIMYLGIHFKFIPPQNFCICRNYISEE